MEIKIVLLAFLSYLSGGIPSGYLIAKRLKGIDIREYGSGNPGAANVYRVVGRWAGGSTMALDMLKGFVPVRIAHGYYPQSHWMLILCGVLAITGHIWTIFLGFRGGKGVATSCGVFAALLPLPTLCAFLIFTLGVAASGHISVGSMLAALSIPILSWAFHSPWPFTAMSAAVAALILLKHLPNIKRLLGGVELHLKSTRKEGH